ncbi:hypothetical protein DFH11DRAFT_1731311 [Phellopilus nigrolimitatus]|nr:hypothetical protein DFH11DRAFT_1731311 [Phellopilus nigrolimitatus]
MAPQAPPHFHFPQLAKYTHRPLFSTVGSAPDSLNCRRPASDVLPSVLPVSAARFHVPHKPGPRITRPSDYSATVTDDRPTPSLPDRSYMTTHPSWATHPASDNNLLSSSAAAPDLPSRMVVSRLPSL